MIKHDVWIVINLLILTLIPFNKKIYSWTLEATCKFIDTKILQKSDNSKEMERAFQTSMMFYLTNNDEKSIDNLFHKF